jgi:LytR_cpsA_psr family
VCAVALGMLAWMTVEYHRFSQDVQASHAALPATVKSGLAPAGDPLNQPQVTLVRAEGKLASGAVVLFRSEPNRRRISFLSLPPSDRLDGKALRLLTIPDLIGELERTHNVHVNHVALIDLSDVSRLVDSLGGIEVNNPNAFDYRLTASRSWHFPQGLIHLDGAHAVTYLRAHGAAIGGPSQDLAERQVLEGVIRQALEPASISRLSATEAVMANYVTTDLTTSDLVGLAWARLQSTQVVRCAVAPRTPLASSRASDALRGFVGETSASPACTSQVIAVSAYTPPRAVAALVQHYGGWVFAAGAMFFALAMMALAAVAGRRLDAWRRPRSAAVDEGMPSTVPDGFGRRSKPRLGAVGLSPLLAGVRAFTVPIRRRRQGLTRPRAILRSPLGAGSLEAGIGPRPQRVLVRRRGVRWFAQAHRWELALYGLGAAVSIVVGLFVGGL